MDNIELTLHLIDELKNFYAIELKNIQRRADEIKGIIEKLGTMALNGSKSASSPTKVRLKAIINDQQQKEFIEPKSRKTKNPNWTNFIVEILKEKDKPMSIHEMLKAYEKQYYSNLPDTKRSAGSLSKALQRLRVNNNRISNIKVNGQNEKLYGLAEWTDNSALMTEKSKKTKPLIKVNKKPKSNNKRDSKPPLPPTDKWTQFVFETLNKTKRVLSAKDFLKYAMVYFNLPKHESETTRVKLVPVLNRLEVIEKSLKACKKAGQTGRFYGLLNWFDDSNKLIVDYK